MKNLFLDAAESTLGQARSRTINRRAKPKGHQSLYGKSHDCSEGYESGMYDVNKAKLWIFPKLAPVPFKVECWMKNVGVTMMQHQLYGNVSFARSWASYKSGFGFYFGDLWLGNDPVYYITNSRPHTLRIAVVTLTYTYNHVEMVRHHTYTNFSISAESSQYRLSFSTESTDTDLGDCLTILKNTPFSTIDVNNVDTCASDFNAGWWFTAGTCSACNPNGVLRRDLVYWTHNVKHTHWTPVPHNFGILEMAMLLIASP
ncbi:angiopoietin-1-like [Gigantopelta aegis]|uniref:angiopoietin-1-like n=1 Tax=Gigantopelta aegis TaxID=1735272 RepID=UPI001B8887B1|nr:angiopoietin-1-like [Gigantopelta aegis]